MRPVSIVLAAMAVTAVGCSRPSAGGAGTPSGAARSGPSMMESGMGSNPAMMTAATAATADTSAAPTAQTATTAVAPDCPPVDKALADRGRAVFSGPGNCFACHAANAQGTALAPNLTDATWLNIDGSYAAIAELVRTGVAKPKQHPAPMPPLGGASLSAPQVCAVAAYVYSISHR